MENENTKKCPYCAEMIKAEAIKCRYCGSNLSKKSLNLDFLTTPGYWHRINEGKKIAGVCTGLAHQFDAPIIIMPLRLFFILTTIFYGFGIILYILLWLLMSPPNDNPNKYSNNKTNTEDRSYANGSTVDEKETPDTAKELNEDFQAENTKNNPETNRTAEKRKMNSFIGTTIIFTCIVITLKIYLFMLKAFWGIILPPAFIFNGFITAGILVTLIGGVLYYKKYNLSLAGKY